MPRAIWIAPLGAMNFAGYELAKRAMGVQSSGTETPEKKENPEKRKARAELVPDVSGASPMASEHAAAVPATAPPQSSSASPAAPASVPAPTPMPPDTAAAAHEPGKAAAGCCAPPAVNAGDAEAPAATAAASAGAGLGEGSNIAATCAAEPPPDTPSGGQPLARIESLRQLAPWNRGLTGGAGVVSHALPRESAHSPVIEAGGGYCAVCGRSGDMPLPAAAGSGVGAPAQTQTLGLPQLRSWLLAWPERW